METKRISHFYSILLLLLFLVATFDVSGQNTQEQDFWENVRFGGGIGLSIDNRFFGVTLAPSAIYQFDSQFATGIALNWTYNSLKNTYTSTIVGGSVITLYNVIPEIQLSAEFEELNVTRKYRDNLLDYTENYWYPALFVGIGFQSRNFTIGIQYDVLYDKEKSIYANPYAPFIRVYF